MHTAWPLSAFGNGAEPKSRLHNENERYGTVRERVVWYAVGSKGGELGVKAKVVR
jgi:hypothetical protein